MTDGRDSFDQPLPRARRPYLAIMALALLAFVAGLAAMGWVLRHWQAAREEIVGSTPASMASAAPAAVAPAAAPLPVMPMAVKPVPVLPPLTEARLGDLEVRMAELARRSEAAIGNASRAEGLLLAVAARRALDRGAPLGFLEGRLRDRFGAAHPQPIAALIQAAREPVTLDSLRTGLDEIAPRLVADQREDSWWQALQRELRGLVVVKRQDLPGTSPMDRIARAHALTDNGQIDRAMAEVNRLPGRAEAAAWLAAARRYVLARNALDALETAALLDPPASINAVAALPAPDAAPLDPARSGYERPAGGQDRGPQ
jgi:hypothetical protein